VKAELAQTMPEEGLVNLVLYWLALLKSSNSLYPFLTDCWVVEMKKLLAIRWLPDITNLAAFDLDETTCK